MLYSNKLNSSLGNWEEDISLLPEKWRIPGAINIGSNSTFAISFGGGIRRKINSKIDINTQLNWQYFFSDGVDGLQADVQENKTNEWLVNFQIGIIYHLNFL